MEDFMTGAADAPPPTPAGIALVVVMYCITVPIAVVSLYSTIKLRNVFPVNGRDLGMLLSFWFSATLAISYFPISGLFPINCFAYAVFELNAQTIGVNAVAFRMGRLWFQYFAAQQQLQKYLFPGRPISTWFAERRHWIKPRNIFKVYLITTVVEILLATLTVIFGPTALLLVPGCPTLGLPVAISNVILVFSLILIVATAIRIRNIQDGYYIKEELKLMLYCAPFLVAAILAHNMLPNRTALPVPVTGIAVGITFCYAFFTVFLWPAWIAVRDQRARAKRRERRAKRLKRQLRRERRQGGGGEGRSVGSGGEGTSIGDTENESHSESDSSSFALRDILTNIAYDDLRQDFADHLAKEFSTENLLFWNETRVYYDQYDNRTDEEVMIHAATVYNDYMCFGAAPFEVNLDAPTRNALQQELVDNTEGFTTERSKFADIKRLRVTKRLPQDIFEKACETVYGLMSRDSYVRWSMSHSNELKRVKTAEHTASSGKDKDKEKDTTVTKSVQSKGPSKSKGKFCSVSHRLKNGGSVPGGNDSDSDSPGDDDDSPSSGDDSDGSLDASSDCSAHEAALSLPNANVFLPASVAAGIESGTAKQTDVAEALGLLPSPLSLVPDAVAIAMGSPSGSRRGRHVFNRSLSRSVAMSLTRSASPPSKAQPASGEMKSASALMKALPKTRPRSQSAATPPVSRARSPSDGNRFVRKPLREVTAALSSDSGSVKGSKAAGSAGADFEGSQRGRVVSSRPITPVGTNRPPLPQQPAPRHSVPHAPRRYSTLPKPKRSIRPTNVSKAGGTNWQDMAREASLMANSSSNARSRASSQSVPHTPRRFGTLPQRSIHSPLIASGMVEVRAGAASPNASNIGSVVSSNVSRLREIARDSPRGSFSAASMSSSSVPPTPRLNPQAPAALPSHSPAPPVSHRTPASSNLSPRTPGFSPRTPRLLSPTAPQGISPPPMPAFSPPPPTPSRGSGVVLPAKSATVRRASLKRAALDFHAVPVASSAPTRPSVLEEPSSGAPRWSATFV